MEDTNKDQQVKEPITPEKAAEMRQKMIEYYSNQKPVLEKQLEFEHLVADIEEQRLRSLIARVKQAQIMMGPEEIHEDPNHNDPNGTGNPPPVDPSTSASSIPPMPGSRKLKQDPEQK